MRPILPLCLVLASVLSAGEAIPALTLRPGDIAISRNISFDDQGRFNKEQVSFRVNLQAIVQARLGGENSRGMMDHEVITLTAADTDTGESILPRGRSNHNLWGLDRTTRMRGRMRGEMPDGSSQFTMGLQLQAPGQPCKAIAKIAGMVKLTVVDPKLRKVEVTNLGALPDAPLAIEGLPGVELRIKRTDKGVDISGSNQSFALLSEVRFVDGDGNQVQNIGMSGSGDGEKRSNSYHVSIPDAGMVQLFFCQNPHEVTIPFTITDIPLEAPPTKVVPPVVLKSTEVDGTEKPVDAAPAPADSGF